MLDKIVEYATEKHKGQFRKDGKTPYITHPISVAHIVETYGGSVEAQAAGILHDVVEDCGVSKEKLTHDLWSILHHPENASGGYGSVKYFMEGRDKSVAEIVKIVDDLTCKYTKDSHPKLNRAQRKKLEIAEFKKVSSLDSKIVKLADIIDNLSSIEKLDTDFAEIYLTEDFRIIRALKIDHSIYKKAVEVFLQASLKMLQ